MDFVSYPVIQTHFSVVMTHPTVPALALGEGRSWLQSVDQPQDFLEQVLWHRDLGHLEGGSEV